MEVRVGVGIGIALVLAGMAGAGVVIGQRGRFGAIDSALDRVPTATNIPYDGRFAFVRLTYETMPGGYWYRGQPAWSHGYPTSNRIS